MVFSESIILPPTIESPSGFGTVGQLIVVSTS